MPGAGPTGQSRAVHFPPLFPSQLGQPPGKLLLDRSCREERTTKFPFNNLTNQHPPTSIRSHRLPSFPIPNSGLSRHHATSNSRFLFGTRPVCSRFTQYQPKKWRPCLLRPSIPKAMLVLTALHPRLSASCSSAGSSSMSSALVSPFVPYLSCSCQLRLEYEQGLTCLALQARRAWASRH